MKRASSGLIHGREFHYLDHLAPLCSILEIPLTVTDPDVAQSARDYYPDLCVLEEDDLALGERLVHHFDLIFYCTPRVLFDEAFFFSQKLLNKKIHTIWCPHGNSDKGKASPFMEALQEEQHALIYGNRMLDFIKEKGVLQRLKKYIFLGNYRYQYYLSQKEFYKKKINQYLSPLQKQKGPLILYAPTWQDHEN